MLNLRLQKRTYNETIRRDVSSLLSKMTIYFSVQNLFCAGSGGSTPVQDEDLEDAPQSPRPASNDYRSPDAEAVAMATADDDQDGEVKRL